MSNNLSVPTNPVFKPRSNSYATNNNTDGYSLGEFSNTFDNQSILTIDKIPTSKPLVNNQDKLWTQIDVLDDVKLMSEQVKQSGSFFDENFNKSTIFLHKSQLKLLEKLNEKEFSRLIDTDDKQVWEVNEYSKRDLFNKKNFDEICKYVDDIRDELKYVTDSMKKVEEASKDLWNDRA